MLGLLAGLWLGAAPLSIEEVRVASRQNLDAIRAELDQARAVQGGRIARSAILPQVNLSASAGGVFGGPQRVFATIPTGPNSYTQTVVDTPSYSQGQFALSVAVSQLLYDGGRWWNQIAQSGAQEAAARGQLEEQRLASELEAVKRFYDWVKAQLSLRVFEATVARSEEQLARAQSLFEAGRSPRSAIFDARTNLANDRISVVRQRQSIALARLALLQWLGQADRPTEAAVPPGLDTPAPAPPVEHALEVALARRPLVKSLRETVRAADLGVDLGWANHLPVVSASAGYTRASPAAELFLSDLSKQNQVQVGASVKLNLFSGFAYDAQLEQARIEATRAKAQERQQLVDLEAEVRRAHESLAIELEVLGMNQDNQKVAEEQFHLEEERFAAGAGSSLEVRNAQLKMTQAELAVLSGRADVAVARAALERTIGGEAP